MAAPGQGAPSVGDSVTSQLRDGTLAYDIPNKMEVGKGVTVEAVISERATQDVVRGLMGGGVPQAEAIRVADSMSVDLEDADGDAFRIRPLLASLQDIRANGGDWQWTVTPLKSGSERLLELVVYAQKESTLRVHIGRRRSAVAGEVVRNERAGLAEAALLVRPD